MLKQMHQLNVAQLRAIDDVSWVNPMSHICHSVSHAYHRGCAFAFDVTSQASNSVLSRSFQWDCVISCLPQFIQQRNADFRAYYKCFTKMKFFIKGLSSRNRSNMNAYILLRNYRKCSMFCVCIHWIK